MDNRYFNYGCPAINSDARNLTNYYPHRTFNQFIRKTNNLESAQDYRHFLQNNGSTIMQNEMNYFLDNNTCSVNGECKPINRMQDEQVKQDVQDEQDEQMDNETFINTNNCGCDK